METSTLLTVFPPPLMLSPVKTVIFKADFQKTQLLNFTSISSNKIRQPRGRKRTKVPLLQRITVVQKRKQHAHCVNRIDRLAV
ncbi:hypothetical protein I7I53_08312 [Histoplasma capsulatum var. duboisii H88]|uniref:Uncharacterized protein n=1 Tax=Ajellomyces capsulatus (strain H88) TaxID=544711 RepID=A0A8A1LI66_AJEC8|nr:hypothetical protein I7I53_08312 [Histoplasma capsulatum var. duboisii H88]